MKDKQTEKERWKANLWKYNLYAVASGLLCLILMKAVNGASVNFFMFPFLIVYLLGLNIVYVLFYRFVPRIGEKKAFRGIIWGTIVLNIFLGVLTVLSVPHR